MKLRYLFSTMLAAALVFAGCTKEEVETLDNLQLTPATYLSISENGGTVTLTVTATEAWEFVVDDNWPDVITRENDGTEKSRVPHWLAADKLSGGAGVTTVTFSASGVPYGREVELSIKAGDHTQFLMVRQGSLEASEATCQDVIDGPDGKTYIVQGVVTAIANTTYGNWYLKDDTGQIYIYGTVDDSGSYNWASFNIEVGDIVKVSGPKTTYGTTVELVDVSVLGVTKSLVEIIKPAGKDAFEVGKDGGKVEVRVAYKGNGVFVGVPDVDWISYDGMDYKAGEPTKIEPNPADTAIVKFVVAPNTGGPREGKVEISSHNSDGSSSNAAVISQLGATGSKGLPFSVSEAISYVKTLGGKTPGDFWVKGIVSKIVDGGEFGSFGNGTFWISEDGVYNDDLDLDFEAYRVYWFDNQKWVEGNAQIAVGAEVLICGKLTVYGNTAETSQNEAYVYSVNGVTTDAEGIGTLADPFTVKGAVAAANAVGGANSSFNAYIKGIVSQIANNGQFGAEYGNGTFWISEDGVYNNDKSLDFEAYRVLWLGNRKWAAGDPEIAVGDEVVLCGAITLYNGTAETASGKAYVYSHNGKTE